MNLLFQDCYEALEDAAEFINQTEFQNFLKENPLEFIALLRLLIDTTQKAISITDLPPHPSSIDFTEIDETVTEGNGVPPHPEPSLLKKNKVRGLNPDVAKGRKGNYPYHMDEQGFILNGPMAGMTIAQTVHCAGCGIKKRVFQTGKWLRRDCCENCRRCIGCDKEHSEGEEWPLPDLCPQCALLTTPDAPLVPSITTSTPPVLLSYKTSLKSSHPEIEPSAPEKETNPFSRKRLHPIGGANTWRQKKWEVEKKRAHT